MLHVTKETTKKHVSKKVARKKRNLERMENDIKRNVCSSTTNYYSNVFNMNYLPAEYATYWKYPHELQEKDIVEDDTNNDRFKQPRQKKREKRHNKKSVRNKNKQSSYSATLYFPQPVHAKTAIKVAEDVFG